MECFALFYFFELGILFQPVNTRNVMNGLSEWKANSLAHLLIRSGLPVLDNSADQCVRLS